MTATLKCSHTSPEWTATTLPPALRHCHCAPHGQFAQWQVLSGTLTMEWLDDTDQVMSTYEASSQQPLPIVPPHQAHRIARVSDDLRCQLSLLCALKDYGHVVHGMTCTHSEVVHAFQHTGPESPLRVLDLGCGGGRNTLYMALKGHHVTAVDHNPSSRRFDWRPLAGHAALHAYRCGHSNGRLYAASTANTKRSALDGWAKHCHCRHRLL